MMLQLKSCAGALLSMLVTQPQQLQEMKRAVPVGQLAVGNMQRLSGCTQTLGGVGLRSARGKRKNARGIHERGRAIELEIERMRVGVIL